MQNLEAKTPTEYINALDGERKKNIREIHNFIRKTVPSLKPHMQWGMIGYGPFHYKYASGREGDWFSVGLASQKNYMALYVCEADGKEYLAEKYKKDLPKANIGKSCIRFRKLEDLDMKVVAKMLKEAEKIYKKKKNKKIIWKI